MATPSTFEVPTMTGSGKKNETPSHYVNFYAVKPDGTRSGKIVGVPVFADAPPILNAIIKAAEAGQADRLVFAVEVNRNTRNDDVDFLEFIPAATK